MLEFADKVIEPESSLSLCHRKLPKPSNSIFFFSPPGWTNSPSGMRSMCLDSFQNQREAEAKSRRWETKSLIGDTSDILADTGRHNLKNLWLKSVCQRKYSSEQNFDHPVGLLSNLCESSLANKAGRRVKTSWDEPSREQKNLQPIDEIMRP